MPVTTTMPVAMSITATAATGMVMDDMSRGVAVVDNVSSRIVIVDDMCRGIAVVVHDNVRIVVNDDIGTIVNDAITIAVDDHPVTGLFDDHRFGSGNVGASWWYGDDVVHSGRDVDRRGLLDHGSSGNRHGLDDCGWSRRYQFGGEEGDTTALAFQVESVEAGPRSPFLENEKRLLGIGTEHLADRIALAVDDAELVELPIGVGRVELDAQVQIFERSGRVACFELGVTVGIALGDLGDGPRPRRCRFGTALGDQDARDGQEKHESTHRTNLLVPGSR